MQGGSLHLGKIHFIGLGFARIEHEIFALNNERDALVFLRGLRRRHVQTCFGCGGTEFSELTFDDFG